MCPGQSRLFYDGIGWGAFLGLLLDLSISGNPAFPGGEIVHPGTDPAVCAVAVPVYGWLAGVSAIRDYRKAHPTNWTSTGIDAWNKYMDKSLPNTIYGAGCAFWTASSCFTGVGLLVNALIILS